MNGFENDGSFMDRFKQYQTGKSSSKAMPAAPEAGTSQEKQPPAAKPKKPDAAISSSLSVQLSRSLSSAKKPSGLPARPVFEQDDEDNDETVELDPKTREAVDKVVDLVVRNGDSAEQKAKDANKTNPAYWFLKDKNSSAYKLFRKTVNEKRSGMPSHNAGKTQLPSSKSLPLLHSKSGRLPVKLEISTPTAGKLTSAVMKPVGLKGVSAIKPAVMKDGVPPMKPLLKKEEPTMKGVIIKQELPATVKGVIKQEESFMKAVIDTVQPAIIKQVAASLKGVLKQETLPIQQTLIKQEPPEDVVCSSQQSKERIRKRKSRWDLTNDQANSPKKQAANFLVPPIGTSAVAPAQGVVRGVTLSAVPPPPMLTNPPPPRLGFGTGAVRHSNVPMSGGLRMGQPAQGMRFPPPGIVGMRPVVGAQLPSVPGPVAGNVNDEKERLCRQLFNTSSANLDPERLRQLNDQWQLAEMERAVEGRRAAERLRALEALLPKGETRLEQELAEGVTKEHEKRAQEMAKTAGDARKVTLAARGKHHISHFLPPDELASINPSTSATVDTSEYRENRLTEENKGFKLLQKMGWREGEGLGAEGTGITAPVGKGKAAADLSGVGAAAQNSEIGEDDDLYSSYRKKMMLAYRFRPNPLVRNIPTFKYNVGKMQ